MLSRVGVKYSTCTWYLYLSTYLSVLDVLEYLVCGNVKVLVLVLVLDQKALDTYSYLASSLQVQCIKKCKCSELLEYIIITVTILGYQPQVTL